MTVVTTVVLARLLDPSDFGVLAVALVVTELLNRLSGLGLNGVLVIRLDLDRRGQGTVFTLLLASGLLAGALVAGLAPIVAGLFHEDTLRDVLIVFAVMVGLSGINWFYEAILTRELAFRRRFVAMTLQTVVYAGVALSLAALDKGVWSLALGVLTGWAAFVVALVWVSPYRVLPTFDREAARTALSAGRGFLLQGMMAFCQSNADYIAVGRMLGTTQLGFYTMAYRIGELPTRAIAEPVGRVTFPAFARMWHAREEIGPAFLSVLRIVSVVACPIGVILSASAAPFIEGVFGSKWLPAIGPLAVLGLWAAIWPIESMFGWMMNAVGLAGVLGRISVIAFVPFVPAVVFGAKFAGTTGVAWAILGQMTAVLLASSAVAHRRAAIRLADQWRALRPAVLSSLPAWTAAHVVAAAGLDPPLLALGASVVAGLGAYSLSICALEPSLPRSGLALLKRMFRRTPAEAA